MKILSNKRYNDLLEKISLQAIEIEELEETNKVARSKYYEQLNECENKENLIRRLTKENESLHKSINSLQSQVCKLSQENRHLEAEIERAKKRF